MMAGRKAPEKFYILDMFPYPSGTGLHVGHPEGYTATDILARYKRAQGFNVLHPMGWDAFGLPAEQYAVKTGQHPRKTTEENIANFKRQIKSLGFSYDWSRELATTDPDYFKWTQWIFLKLYNSYFDPEWKKATSIELLEDALLDNPKRKEEWKDNPFLAGTHDGYISADKESRKDARRRLIKRSRLAYVSEAPVNWCPELGTVLANEEVIDGKSEIGGFPVVRKPMRQWMLRITAYAEKLLADLDTIDWTDSLKEMQRNWIGKSEGAEVHFPVAGNGLGGTGQRPVLSGDSPDKLADTAGKLPAETGGSPVPPRMATTITVFTTRPDTLFGATYMVLSPEHKLVDQITTPEQKKAVEEYKAFASGKSDLERTELAKEKTGVFTGAFAINPVNSEKIPIWIADYVLASYGTGAIMAVPAHDKRDFEFAKKFNLPIIQVVQPPDAKTDWQGFTDDGTAVNSGFLNGLPTAEAKKKISAWLEGKNLGKKTVNYKLRDWLFSRQRYWGEPFPIVWKKGPDGQSYHEALPESELPLLPPSLEDYKPTPSGEPPLARAKNWLNLPDGSVRETNTMPQWAGSCWYYLRYLDAKNASAFVGKDVENYWMGRIVKSLNGENVKSEAGSTIQRFTDSTKPGIDLYVGGTEHAVLHLLYARFWHKVLFDLGYVSTPEPFFKLVNQGTILGEDGQKMSKSRGNVVNPDDVLVEYGADAFRLYEMFMGPLQDTKPWNTRASRACIVSSAACGVCSWMKNRKRNLNRRRHTTKAQSHQELLNLIKLNASIKDVAATPAQLKTLHACIKKVTEDLDGMRFNTAISAMMVFVNDAIPWETKPVSVLRNFLTLLQPFAPHLSEELWGKLNIQHSTFNIQHPETLAYAVWPKFDAARLVENEIEIPVQVNGKLRDVIKVSVNATAAELETLALANEKAKPYLEGKTIRKIIVVPKKLVNIVAV